MKTIVHLHPNDNIAVSIKEISKGDLVSLKSNTIEVQETIQFGHKIAVTPIKKGTKIFKYGVPIGISTEEIGVGYHVHTHNIKSLYMSQFTNQE